MLAAYDVDATCPCCGRKIEVLIDPGEDRAIPPIRPSVDEVKGCECSLYLEVLVKETPEGKRSAYELYHQQILEEVL